ncbi:hypothetical protein [uncultured Mediterranean phage]|nr:hypothetical protein [uncultured Mediterranean phage]
MSRWGKPTKNKRRVDPRYFLKEESRPATDLAESEMPAEPAQDFAYTPLPLPQLSNEGPSMYSGDNPRYSPTQPAKKSNNLNPWDATYEGASEQSIPGFARTAAETAIETAGKANPFARNLGLGTDISDLAVHAHAGRTGEAVKTGASALADIVGGVGGGLVGATPFGLATGGPPVWVPAGAAVADTAYRALPGQETAGRMYDKYGFLGTLGRGAEELGDAIGRNFGPSAWNSQGPPGQKNENKERSLVTEQQYKRFQKLAAINNSKQDKTMLTEEITTGFIIGMVIFALFGDELQSRGLNQTPGIATKLAKGAISAWNSLKQKASSLTQQGDSSLDSVIGEIESSANQAGPSLSGEQIAMIQQQFSDDQQLALMIEELAEIPPEQHQQAIAKIEQYIRTKLQ